MDHLPDCYKAGRVTAPSRRAATRGEKIRPPGQDPVGDTARRYYPEVAAGGYSHVDGTVEFYQRIHALLSPGMTVVDFGAGRGQFLEDPVPLRRDLHQLRGKVARVVGLDIDPAVLENASLDEAIVITPGLPLPLPDASVDLVLSDWTFEHVSDPAAAAGELTRILRVGGWLCARTPNRYGYIGLATRAVPNRLHTSVLRRVQPGKPARDTFPTRYLLNTRSALSRYFPEANFEHFVYAMNNEPAYFGSSRVGWSLTRFAYRFCPDSCAATMYVFLRKHAQAGGQR